MLPFVLGNLPCLRAKKNVGLWPEFVIVRSRFVTSSQHKMLQQIEDSLSRSHSQVGVAFLQTRSFACQACMYISSLFIGGQQGGQSCRGGEEEC